MSGDRQRAWPPPSPAPLESQVTYQPHQPQQPQPQRASSPQQPMMRTVAGYGSPDPMSAVPPPAYTPRPHAQHSNPLAGGAQTSVINREESANIARGKLSVLSGEQAGEEWYLNRVNTSLGRALENDIILLDIASSRKHAQLIRHSEGFTLLDLQSANGIYINQRRISEEEVYDGDLIEIGETQIRFDTVGGAPRVRQSVYSQTFMGRQPRREAPHAEVDLSAQRPALAPSPPAQVTPPMLPDQGWRSQKPRERSQERSAPPLEIPITPIQDLTHQPESPFNPKQTYGFGSQMTPEQLTLSHQEQQYHLQSAKAISPLNRLRQQVDHLINLARFGRGRGALVMRLTMILTALLFCFLIGAYLRHLGSSWTASSSSVHTSSGVVMGARRDSGGQVSASSGSTETASGQASRSGSGSTGEATSLTTSPATQGGHSAHPQHNALLKLTSELARGGRWDELLNTLEAQLSSEQRSQPWAQSLRDQAERGLIQSEMPKLRDALRRGQLKRVFKDFTLLFKRLSLEGRATLSYFDYALWLYRRELKGAERINPPYSEQRMLKQAAREVTEGQRSRAQKTLRRARVARARRALIALRLEALTTNHPRRKLELAYLLGEPRDAHLLLEHYNSEIREGVKSGNYKTIAPLIEGGIKLASRHPRTLKSLLSTQRQLRAGALKWFGDARAIRARKPKQARIFLEAALPYLEEPQQSEALKLLRDLR